MTPDMMPESTGEMNHDPTVGDNREKKTLEVKVRTRHTIRTLVEKPIAHSISSCPQIHHFTKIVVLSTGNIDHRF